MERVSAEALSGLTGELAGKYYRLSEMTDKEQEQLIEVSVPGRGRALADPAWLGEKATRRKSREDQTQLMVSVGPGHLLSGTACNFPQGPLAACHHHRFLSPSGYRQQLCQG